MWYQKTLTLSAKSRGFHLVTDEILNQLADMPRVNIGLLHLLLQHTSASLTLNENCDPTVRHDMERFFLRAVPDNGNYEHDYEGADDMPSHIKSSMLGTSLVLPPAQLRDEAGRRWIRYDVSHQVRVASHEVYHIVSILAVRFLLLFHTAIPTVLPINPNDISIVVDIQVNTWVRGSIVQRDCTDTQVFQPLRPYLIVIDVGCCEHGINKAFSNRPEPFYVS